MVITVIRKNRRLQTIVNLFILNMAVSDLLIPLLAIPKRIHDIYVPMNSVMLVDGVFGLIICTFIPFVNYTSMAVSICTLQILTVERFFSVVYPMKKQPIQSKKRCVISICGTWLVGVLSFAHKLYKNKVIHKNGEPVCKSSWEPAFRDSEAPRVQWPITTALFVVFPLILMTSLYSAIIVSLQRQKVNLHLASEEIQRRAKKYRQITLMLVTVVVLFFATWIPFNTCILYLIFTANSQDGCFLTPILHFSTFLIDLCPAINPFIYYIFNENYRKGFQDLSNCVPRHILCCKKQSSPGPVEGHLKQLGSQKRGRQRKRLSVS